MRLLIPIVGLLAGALALAVPAASGAAEARHGATTRSTASTSRPSVCIELTGSSLAEPSAAPHAAR